MKRTLPQRWNAHKEDSFLSSLLKSQNINKCTLFDMLGFKTQTLLKQCTKWNLHKLLSKSEWSIQYS